MTSRSALRRRRSPVWLELASGLVFLLALCSPSAASAEPRKAIELTWTAPPECPTVEEVRARVQKLAGAQKSTAHALHADATVTHNDDGGRHLHLLVRGGSLSGERNIGGKSCPGVVGAL